MDMMGISIAPQNNASHTLYIQTRLIPRPYLMQLMFRMPGFVIPKAQQMTTNGQ
jgi:hypothetical protein